MIVRKICCIGADNVGGPFSSILAYKCPEIDVKVVDQNEETIMKWNSPQLPVYENNLDDIVKSCRGRNLFFTSEIGPAIKEADLVFICANMDLKTHGMGKGKAINLKPLEDAARLVSEYAVTSKIIVEKSTLPLRGAETVANVLKANYQTGRKFIVLSNPQFLSQGTAVHDLLFPDRILIGGKNSAQGKVGIETLISIYENWVPRNKILTSDTWSIELAKIATNALVAQKMSSINSLTEVCEATNSDILDVATAVGMNPKIGPKALKPGIGFGGPSLHKDILSIVYLCESLKLFQAAVYWQKILDINEYQKWRFTRKILDAFYNTLAGKYFAIYGFSFKKDTADTTESPAIFVCKTLLEDGANLKIYDPVVPECQIMKDLKTACEMDEEKLTNAVAVLEDPYEATSGTNAIVICTNWTQFATIDYSKVYKEMVKPAHIFDGWRMLPHGELVEIGFTVDTIGKNINVDVNANRETISA